MTVFVPHLSETDPKKIILSLQQLGAVSNAVDSNNNPLPITLTLSAQYGTLDFNNVAAPNGVTVTFAAGNKSVTLVGNETAIKTYLLNFGYMPVAGYVTLAEYKALQGATT